MSERATDETSRSRPDAPLRIGVIGCGWISEAVHLPALARMPGVEVAALADTRESALAAARALAPGARTYGSADALIDAAEIGAVLLALPPLAVPDVAVAAFAAGRDAYIEKPLAADPEGADRILRAWRESGRIAMAGYNFRRAPVHEAARDALAEGRLGRLVAIQSRFTWGAEARTDWRADPGLGGALIDLAGHHVDLGIELAGGLPESVSARLSSLNAPDDTATLTLGWADGLTQQIHASLAAGANTIRLTLLGTRGQLDGDLLARTPPPLLAGDRHLSRLGRVSAGLRGLSPARLLHGRSDPSFTRSLGAFVEACRTRRQPRPSPEDACAVIAVLAAARRSAAAGGRPEAVAGDPPA